MHFWWIDFINLNVLGQRNKRWMQNMVWYREKSMKSIHKVANSLCLKQIHILCFTKINPYYWYLQAASLICTNHKVFMSFQHQMALRFSCLDSVSSWWMLFMLQFGNCKPKGYVERDLYRNHTPFVIIPSKAAFWCSCNCPKHTFHISEFVWVDRKKSK